MDKTVCFTGHRPNKLPGKYNWYDAKNIAMLKELRNIIVYLIENNNAKNFITGGALGVDQMAFKVIQKLKKDKYPDITQILAIPFAKQDNNWIDESKRLYQEIKAEADVLVYVDELYDYELNIEGLNKGDYHPAKMQKRNEYMVDNSDIVIAVFNGDRSGGTFNCVKYAEKNKKEIINLNPDIFK